MELRAKDRPLLPVLMMLTALQVLTALMRGSAVPSARGRGGQGGQGAGGARCGVAAGERMQFAPTPLVCTRPAPGARGAQRVGRQPLLRRLRGVPASARVRCASLELVHVVMSAGMSATARTSSRAAAAAHSGAAARTMLLGFSDPCARAACA